MKQVIIIRKDLKMNRGKEIAQACHASTKWLLDKVAVGAGLTKDEKSWATGSQAKVTLQVNGLDELHAIHEAALKRGLKSVLITDSGKTVFNGVPTDTCVAIGPDDPDEIDAVTGNLKLY